VVGFYEHGNEPSVSTKGGEFLDQMSDYQLLKKEFVKNKYKLQLATLLM
jgi:hypothetical protein